MVHALVSEEYIYISLIYTTDHVFPVLPIKRLLNQESEPTTPHKLATGSKTPVTNLRALLCTCVVRKSTTHVYTKALNIHHYSQNIFGISLLEFHNIKKGTSSMYQLHGK